MTRHDSGTTRRNVLAGAAGLLAASTAGCTSEASAALQNCMGSEPADRELARKKGRTQEYTGALEHLPTDESRGDADLALGISGRTASAGDGDGTAIHTLHLAWGNPDVGIWWHDRVDMTAYGGEDASEGRPVYEASASALEEGGTTVLLVAENDRGMVASPDAEHFTALLPERIRELAVGLDE